MESEMSIVRGWRYLAAYIPLLLASCSQDDRVAIVTCSAGGIGAIPVATELWNREQRTLATGYLNTWGLNLGSIVRVTGGSPWPRAIVEWRAVTPSKPNASLTAVALRSAAVGDGFQVLLDDDFRANALGSGLNLDSAILERTMLYIFNARVWSLPDVVAALNETPDIAAGIRAATSDRFAIVSEAVNGDDLSLSSKSVAAVNTLDLGGAYVHVRYSCRAVERLKDQVLRTGGLVPLIIYLTPIIYDETTSRIAPDVRSMDLSRHN